MTAFAVLILALLASLAMLVFTTWDCFIHPTFLHLEAQEKFAALRAEIQEVQELIDANPNPKVKENASAILWGAKQCLESANAPIYPLEQSVDWQAIIVLLQDGLRETARARHCAQQKDWPV